MATDIKYVTEDRTKMTFKIKRAANAYRNVEVASAVPYADSIQLIQMLFDGLIASLSDAEGH